MAAAKRQNRRVKQASPVLAAAEPGTTKAQE